MLLSSAVPRLNVTGRLMKEARELKAEAASDIQGSAAFGFRT